MSDKARKSIEQAIRSHLDDDGASERGAYRDVLPLLAVVTEVLHLAKKKFPNLSNEELFHITCDEGYDIFMEELELRELDKLNNIPDRELPLHSINEFEFESVKKAFEKRLKGDDHGKEEKKIT
jgi:hypothetical protein